MQPLRSAIASAASARTGTLLEATLVKRVVKRRLRRATRGSMRERI
jgi:hypothetical protein